MGVYKKSVKTVVVETLKKEIEQGRISESDLLNASYGRCQDIGLYITTLCNQSQQAVQYVRTETVQVYIRAYKRQLKNKSAKQ